LRVNGAMDELSRKRNSELRELASSEYAPGGSATVGLLQSDVGTAVEG